MIDFPSLPPLPEATEERGFRTVMADPPWAYDDDLPGPGRGAGSHYDTLHAGSVAGMGPQIRKVTSPSAHLYLWTTNSFMQEAFDVVDAWGFTPKTILTWVKVLDEPTSLPHERDGPVPIQERIGMGHYLRNTTEHVVFATKSNRSTNRSDVPTHFFAERTEHSRKPEKAYALVETLSDAPRLELFSRSTRDGWTAWGDEADDSGGDDA